MRAMDNLPVAAAVLGGLLLFSIYLWLSAQRKAGPTAESPLELFARKHGLSLASPTEVRGLYGQRPLRLSTESRVTDGATAQVTLISVDVSDALPAEFGLKRAAPGSTPPPVEGAAEPAKEAESIESAFTLTNASPETREALNSPAVRESCTRLAGNADFHIENGWLHVEHRGVPSTAEAMEALVESVLEAPRALATSVTSLRFRPSA
jgi:hypothetical protein